MIKYGYLIIIIVIYVFITSCDSENAWNCFQDTGKIVQIPVETDFFEKITVFQRTQLIVQQGDEQKVVLESGDNLINDIDIIVEDGTLIIDNKNACNLTREYGITKVRVITDTLTEIRNASGLTVQSEGILSFPLLTLRSEDLMEEDQFRKDGDFEMQLDCKELIIETNGKSNFFLDGIADDVTINFLDGDNRCECRELQIQNASIFHRGTNDIFIAPEQSVSGELRSAGNLVITGQTPVIDVQAFYTGQVIRE